MPIVVIFDFSVDEVVLEKFDEKSDNRCDPNLAQLFSH